LNPAAFRQATGKLACFLYYGGLIRTVRFELKELFEAVGLPC